MKLLPVLLGGAALVGAAVLLQKKDRFVGDAARVGDEVLVPITSLPAGSLPAVFPANAGYIGVQVTAATGETLSGPIVAYAVQEIPNLTRLSLPVPAGPITVPRSLVTSVYRGTARVA